MSFIQELQKHREQALDTYYNNIKNHLLRLIARYPTLSQHEISITSDRGQYNTVVGYQAYQEYHEINTSVQQTYQYLKMRFEQDGMKTSYYRKKYWMSYDDMLVVILPDM